MHRPLENAFEAFPGLKAASADRTSEITEEPRHV
jgi:hypothetical protein